MKKAIRFTVVVAVLILALQSFGGTARVFVQNLGGNLKTPNDVQQEHYVQFLSGYNIDFGVFYGPTSASNFGLTADGYSATVEYNSETSSYGGGRVLVYKTALWEVAAHYSPTNYYNSGKMWCESYVMQRKSNGEQFLVVFCTGNRFDKGSYCNPLRSYVAEKAALHPGVWSLVALPYNNSLGKIYSGDNVLSSNLTGNGYTRTLTADGTGAVFAKNHTTLSASGSAVSQSTLGFGSEPAALATITYQRSFSVTFNDWDGTTLKTETVYEGNNATPPADPTRTGYHFTGWSGSYQNVQSNITVTAQYEINTYTVRFLDWNGTVLKSETVNHGSDATPPADPTREGYRFAGWQGAYTGITADTDITATYVEASAVTHFVTFLDWNGTQLSRQEIIEGEDAVPPADPTREGYHFTGWSGSYTNVQQDETVTATYAINTYTVQFLDHDNTLLKSETVNHGANATPPADPERTGYAFVGWQGIYENVTADSTVVAQYSINHYTVTFQYEDGTVISQQTVEYQGSATKPANPAPPDDDHVFYRWNGSYTGVTADTTVTAEFVNKVIEVGTGAEFGEYLGNATLMAMPAVTLALTNDISMSGVSYTKPSLQATIDGRGHTVTGLASSFRLLSDLRGGTVRDIVFKGFHSPGNANRTSIIVSSSYVGSTLSGVVLEDCHWTVPSGSYGTSGLIYEVKGSTLMTNCVMRNCSVLGVNAGGNGQYVGGFVAIASNLRLVDCHFVVDDTDAVAVGDGIHAAGAFIGRCGSSVAIERCSNNAHVRVAKYTGAEGGAGGFVGFANSSSGSPTITDSANFGIVDATVNYPAGGFIGDVGTVESDFALTLRSCFNYGAVSSPVAAGGLVGSFRGVKNKLNNDGNSGTITSVTGFAGGLVGRVLYVGDDKSFGFGNALQVGAVSTETGLAGTLVGGIEASTGSGLSMVVSNVFMAGSAVATDGGHAGLLFGGRDTVSENEMTFVMDGCRVLESNASLPLYYNGANAAVPWDSSTTFGPSALIDWSLRNALNDYAVGHGNTMWIQGEEFPELETFGTEYSPGLMIIFK